MTDPVMLLSQVHGEGRVTFRALRAAGFYTLAGVAQASIHQLSERAHLSVQTARRLKAGADEMLGRGLGEPEPDEPVKQTPQRSRSARGMRYAPTDAASSVRAAAAPAFSAGISIEEALLLAGTWETKPEPFCTTADVLAPPAEALPVTGALPANGAPAASAATTAAARIPEMAAAAEAAASLVRVPVIDKSAPQEKPQAAVAPVREQAEPLEENRVPLTTFWSFG